MAAGYLAALGRPRFPQRLQRPVLSRWSSVPSCPRGRDSVAPHLHPLVISVEGHQQNFGLPLVFSESTPRSNTNKDH